MVTLHVDGSRVADIASFYDELDRVFMVGVDWRLGPSLDALNDVLYGGYGTLQDGEAATVVIDDSERVRAALGRAATIAWQREKAGRPGFSHAAAEAAIAELEAGGGQLYFDIVLEVFADHPEITLVLA